MKTGIFLMLCITFLSSCLAGCLPREHFKMKKDMNLTFESNSHLISIHISNLKADDKHIINDKETLNGLQRILSSAIKIEGLVNKADPQYSLNVQYDDEKQHDFYLWIGEKGEKSTLMKTDDTHTIYMVTIEETEQLIDIIDSRSVQKNISRNFISIPYPIYRIETG